jgi:hypothetical protein
MIRRPGGYRTPYKSRRCPKGLGNELKRSALIRGLLLLHGRGPRYDLAVTMTATTRAGATTATATIRGHVSTACVLGGEILEVSSVCLRAARAIGLPIVEVIRLLAAATASALMSALTIPRGVVVILTARGARHLVVSGLTNDALLRERKFVVLLGGVKTGRPPHLRPRANNVRARAVLMR